METSNRIKIISISLEDVLVAFLGVGRELPKSLVVHNIDLLPDGCKVERVYHNYERNCFDFVVSHPSFPPHEPGWQIERISRSVATAVVVRIPIL